MLGSSAAFSGELLFFLQLYYSEDPKPVLVKVQTSSKRFFGKNAKLLTLDKIQICVYAQYTLTALDSVMQYPDWLNAGYVMAIAGIWRGTPRPGQFMVLAAVRYLQVGYAQSIFRTMPPIPITIVTGFLGTRCSWA